MKKSSLLLIIVGLPLLPAMSRGDVIYNNLPDSLSPNYASLGYQATQTSEFGKKIEFAAGYRRLDSATITMSDWARHSDFPTYGTDTGFYHDITMNIYSVANDGGLGALLGSKTQNVFIPYRPDGEGPYLGSDGNYYSGIAFNVKFDLSSLALTVPDKIIYGVAYNTESYGASPMGVAGPYNSLNYACDDVATTVGTDLSMDTVYWNTGHAAFYSDGGAGGVGTFREDSNWTGFRPMAKFEAVPEPASMAVVGLGLLGFLKGRKRTA